MYLSSLALWSCVYKSDALSSVHLQQLQDHLKRKLKTKQMAPTSKQLLGHGKQTLAKLRCENKATVEF